MAPRGARGVECLLRAADERPPLVMLIILAGLPGTGKTTIARELARQLSAVHVRIDSIEQAIRNSGVVVVSLDDAGYRAAYAVAEDNLRLGHTVIADSVNPEHATRDAWVDVANRAGVPFVEVEVTCSDRREHRRRVETRTSDIPAHKLPTWLQVVEREYHAWDRERIVIETASETAEAAVTKLRELLENRTEPRARADNSDSEAWLITESGERVPMTIVHATPAEARTGKEKLRACVSIWTGQPGLFVEDPHLALIVTLRTVACDDRGFQLRLAVPEVMCAPADFDPENGIERSCAWNQPYMSFDAGGMYVPYCFYLHFGADGVARVRERWAGIPADRRRYDSTMRGFLRACF